jgi:hypothetical protein
MAHVSAFRWSLSSADRLKVGLRRPKRLRLEATGSFRVEG